MQRRRARCACAGSTTSSTTTTRRTRSPSHSVRMYASRYVGRFLPPPHPPFSPSSFALGQHGDQENIADRTDRETKETAPFGGPTVQPNTPRPFRVVRNPERTAFSSGDRPYSQTTAPRAFPAGTRARRIGRPPLLIERGRGERRRRPRARWRRRGASAGPKPWFRQRRRRRNRHLVNGDRHARDLLRAVLRVSMPGLVPQVPREQLRARRGSVRRGDRAPAVWELVADL